MPSNLHLHVKNEHIRNVDGMKTLRRSIFLIIPLICLFWLMICYVQAYVGVIPVMLQ